MLNDRSAGQRALIYGCVIYWYTRCVCTIVCNRGENPAWIRLHEQAARYAVLAASAWTNPLQNSRSDLLPVYRSCNGVQQVRFSVVLLRLVTWQLYLVDRDSDQLLQSFDSFRPSLSLQSALRHCSIGFQATSEDISVSSFVSVIGLFIWRLIFNIRTVLIST